MARPIPIQLAATPVNNQILSIVLGALSCGLLVNANVDAAAAIDGTKISPNFGAQNVLTSGTLGAGATTVTSLTDSGLGLGVVHSSGGGLFSSSNIVNADVDAAAAIDGTKVSPNFGAQAVSTTGTGSFGTSLTVTSLGLGVVHSSGGGLFSSSNIVNADVDAAAAIAVSKLAAGTNGFVLQTAAGVPTWALVPAASLAPGAASTVLVTNAGATATTFALLVNANVDAAAAIAGTKISPNFGAQAVSTTGTGSFGTSLTVTSLGLGVVHSSGGGLFSSSNIVNADIDAAAAIAVS